MPSCYKCGEPFIDQGLAPDAVCGKCSSWLHCCANCINYDELTNIKCREPRAPFVSDRQLKNTCPFFRCKQVVRDDRRKEGMSARGEQRDRQDRARQNLDKLFSG